MLLFKKLYSHIINKRVALHLLIFATVSSPTITYASVRNNFSSLSEAHIMIGLIMAIFAMFLSLIIFMNQRARNALKKLAYEDEITGLPTLTKFSKDSVSILKSAVPMEYMVITMDINNFKYINDSFGYSVGNEVLDNLAEVLQKSVYPGELLGRIGTDNFVFLCKAVPYSQCIRRFNSLSRVGANISRVLPEHYNVSFSCGVYFISDPSLDLSLMIDRANVARKSIKGSHASAIAEYTPEMNTQMEWKREITLSMGQALANEEFEMYLQPKFSFTSEKMVGAEALVRWNHPQRGVIPPDTFIPIFEKNGFVKKIDLYIFEQACTLIKKWECDEKITLPISISVNLSRLHLYNRDIVAQLLELTVKHDVSPQNIEIEITESMMFYDTNELIKTMHRLKKAGFKLSIDDFGSGYSSLNLLKDLPVDILKLDRAFLEGSYDTDAGQIIITKIIEMTKGLHLITVAEGVETERQAAMLMAMGCNIAQGYYYARPMSVADFEILLFNQQNSSKALAE